jgi:putative FmdB family regulatory protein
MPIFEYKCKQCGHTMEVLQRGSRSSPGRCERCGGKTLQKLFSTFSTGQGSSSADSGGSCPTGTCPLG